MGYSEKFEIVKSNIIKECKKDISDNWLMMFDMWLSCEADWEFPHNYKKAFNDEFSKYMKPEIETLLWLFGKNIVFAISTYISIKEDADLNEVLDFTERFIENQLEDFDNCCDDIMMAMYEESSEYERDNSIVNSVVNTNTEIIIENNSISLDNSENTLDTSVSGVDILNTLPKKAISKIKSKIASNNKKDETKYGIKGDLTLDEFITKMNKQNGKCYICLQDFKYDGGKFCDFFPSPDRINNNIKHTSVNIAISCTYCNLRTWKEGYLGHEIKKVCGHCEGLNHTHQEYISTKSVLYRALGNNNTRIYEYAQNPSQHYLNKD